MAQSGQIQGSSSNAGDLYQEKDDKGVGSADNPKARIHIFNGVYDSKPQFRGKRPFLVSGFYQQYCTDVEGNALVNGNETVNGNEIVNRNETVNNGNLTINNGYLLITGNINGSSIGSNEIKLMKDGYIRCREVKVDLDVIPDYVFKTAYKLMPLKELKKIVEINKHLPNIKSEKEFKEEGSISLTEMNLKLLEKVEELTLYVIDLQEQISELKIK